MNRREFVLGAAAAAASLAADRTPHSVRIAIDTGRRLGAIPADFTGFGYEISSVAIPNLLSAQNPVYVQLLKTLGSSGVIRIGGNTSDYSSFSAEGTAVSAPTGTVLNTASLRQLATFLNATGWKLIWGLNLGHGDERQAIAEAQSVIREVQENLLAFEIGNEPDLFGRGAAHRPAGYGYDAYLAEYRRYKAAIRAQLPTAPFAGPDVASATDWVTRFAADEGRGLKLLTHHYYRECANPGSTLEKLLHPDPKLAPALAKLQAASATSRVPYRICETNSFCGGGKAGVSDTFGAALWVLDFMFTLASANCAGVNIETGVNQLGFVSSYSPVTERQPGSYSAKPEYYGMLAFSQASQGERVAVDCEASGLNLTAFSAITERSLALAIVNKDAARDAQVSISVTNRLSSASVLRLSAPSLDSREGVTLGGASVDAHGEWKPRTSERLAHMRAGTGVRFETIVPAASAAILKWPD